MTEFKIMPCFFYRHNQLQSVELNHCFNWSNRCASAIQLSNRLFMLNIVVVIRSVHNHAAILKSQGKIGLIDSEQKDLPQLKHWLSGILINDPS